MILYSIVPPEIVFSNNNNNKETENDYVEIEYLGEKVLAYNTSQNEYVVDRVISTSLQAFLNAKLMPGQKIIKYLK